MRQLSIRQVKSSFYLIPLFLFGLLIGCNSDPTTTSPAAGNFSLSVKNNPGSFGIAQSDTLVLNTVKIMMKNVELFSDSMGEKWHHEENEEVESGPFVVVLNLNGSINTIALTTIPAGIYNGVNFEIHRLNRNEAVIDSEFIDSTCGEKGYSIVVEGTYLGNPFVFKSRNSVNQHVLFTNPVTVTTDGLINVTLTVDPYSWFNQNGNYVDPNNPDNFWLINRLIKESFRNCFKDDDRNGDPDH